MLQGEVKMLGGNLRVSIVGGLPMTAGRPPANGTKILHTAGKVGATPADEQRAREALEVLGISEVTL
jgi:hypothetical protein